MRMGRILGLAVAMAFLVAAPAVADSDNAAIVLKDLDHPSGCFLPASVGGAPPLFTADEITTVATSSGNVTLTCHFTYPEGFEPPTTAVRVTGFACGIFLPGGGAVTTDTMAVRTPGGRATLVCRVRRSDLP